MESGWKGEAGGKMRIFQSEYQGGTESGGKEEV